MCVRTDNTNGGRRARGGGVRDSHPEQRPRKTLADVPDVRNNNREEVVKGAAATCAIVIPNDNRPRPSLICVRRVRKDNPEQPKSSEWRNSAVDPGRQPCGVGTVTDLRETTIPNCPDRPGSIVKPDDNPRRSRN
jgi:hypothetical protein